MKHLFSRAKTALVALLLLIGVSSTAQPFVEVLQPQLGDVWVIGSTKLISWNTNFSQPVKIDLVNLTGNVVTPIVASTVNSTYSWYIDELVYTPGDNYIIRVTSTVSASYTDDSEVFELAESAPGTYVSLQQPNATGINWLNNSTYLISWDTDLGGSFKLELIDYTNLALPVTTLIAGAAPASTYLWTIPNNTVAGTKYKVKITSNNDNSKTDISDQYFTISISPSGAYIDVLQPDEAGLKLVRGTQYLISWIDDVPGNVDLELYSTEPFTIASDDAGNYGGIWADGDNEGSGFEPWDISDGDDGSGGVSDYFIGDPSLAGITGMDNPSFGIRAYSNPTTSTLNFVKADRELSTPLEVGSTLSLDWAFHWASGAAGEGDKGIILYSGGVLGTEILRINVAGDVAPVSITGGTMFNNFGNNAMDLNFEMVDEETLRVYGTGRDGVETYDQNFTITAAPDAIRFYTEAQSSSDLQRVLYFNNLRVTRHTMDIALDVVGSTHVWSILGSLSTTASYKVIVADQSGEITGQSTNFFTLLTNPENTFIEVLQPNTSGMDIVRGTSYLISWNDNVPGPVDVYLQPGNVLLGNDVVGSTLVWNVPSGLALGAYTIQVRASNDASVQDSGASFDIIAYPTGGTLEVLQPSLNGIVWLRGNEYLISWTSDFATGPVNIELYKGGTAPGNFLATLVSNYEGSTWVWDIPELTYVVGDDYYIRVTAFSASVSDFSNFDFSLADTPGGTIEVLQPNGNEILYTNQGYLISWIDNIPEPVNIFLIDDAAPTSVTSLATSVIGSTWVWNIPLGTDAHAFYKIRIESIYSSLIFDESNNYFTITPLPMTFSVFPNPARDNVTVRFDELANDTFTLKLTDRFNTQVLLQKVDARSMKEFRISTAELPNGVYFLSVTSNESKTVQKIMVQH